MSKFHINLLVQFSKVLSNSKINRNLKRISFLILGRLQTQPSRGPPLHSPWPAHSPFPYHWAPAANHHWASAFGRPSQPARPALSRRHVGPRPVVFVPRLNGRCQHRRLTCACMHRLSTPPFHSQNGWSTPSSLPTTAPADPS
jgi:hypothetical protein